MFGLPGDWPGSSARVQNNTPFGFFANPVTQPKIVRAPFCCCDQARSPAIAVIAKGLHLLGNVHTARIDE